MLGLYFIDFHHICQKSQRNHLKSTLPIMISRIQRLRNQLCYHETTIELTGLQNKLHNCITYISRRSHSITMLDFVQLNDKFPTFLANKKLPTTRKNHSAPNISQLQHSEKRIVSHLDGDMPSQRIIFPMIKTVLKFPTRGLYPLIQCGNGPRS